MTTSALKKHRVGRADVVIGPYKEEKSCKLSLAAFLISGHTR